jgi:hypothetical protein
VAEVYDDSPAPALHAITPSRELGYPLWSFRRSALEAAMALGRADAEAVLAGAGG